MIAIERYGCRVAADGDDAIDYIPHPQGKMANVDLQ
jgi:hypothetical protein